MSQRKPRDLRTWHVCKRFSRTAATAAACSRKTFTVFQSLRMSTRWPGNGQPGWCPKPFCLCGEGRGNPDISWCNYPDSIGFLSKIFEGRFGEAMHFITLYYTYTLYRFALLGSVVEALADHSALPELQVSRFVEGSKIVAMYSSVSCNNRICERCSRCGK